MHVTNHALDVGGHAFLVGRHGTCFRDEEVRNETQFPSELDRSVRAAASAKPWIVKVDRANAKRMRVRRSDQHWPEELASVNQSRSHARSDAHNNEMSPIPVRHPTRGFTPHHRLSSTWVLDGIIRCRTICAENDARVLRASDVLRLMYSNRPHRRESVASTDTPGVLPLSNRETRWQIGCFCSLHRLEKALR